MTEEATPEVIHLPSDFVTKDGAIIDQNNKNEKEQQNVVDINDDESVLVHCPESPKSGEEKRKEYGKYKLQQSSTTTNGTTPLFPNDSESNTAGAAQQPNSVGTDQRRSEHNSIQVLVQNM